MTLAALLAFATGHGFHRDEFYIRESGRHLAWGYPDHPPLSPLLARLADELAPDSLLVLRTPPALGAAMTVLLIGLIAREFGGTRPAQFLAATVAAGSIIVLAGGHLLTTSSIDVVFATALAFVLARMIRTGDVRLWPVAGVLLGLGLLNRVFLVVYAVVVVAAVAAVGPRTLLRTIWFPVGVVVASVIAAPTVVWQASNGWPEWEMATAISADNSRWELLALQGVIVGPLLLPLWLAGLWWLLRHPPVRCFGVAYLGLLAVLLVTSGATHYLFNAYPPLLAAAGISCAGWLTTGARALRTAALATLLAFSTALAAVSALPVLPVPVLAGTPIVAMNKEMGEQIGWPEMGRTVADVVNGLPAEVRARTVVLADNYGQAGAIAHFGPDHVTGGTAFPPVHSGHQAYGWWGPPPDHYTTAVMLGTDAPSTIPHWAGRACGRITEVATVRNDHGIANTENGTRVFLCEDLTATWSELWPHIRRVGPAPMPQN
ncbi:MAG TPA: glycosyltransferase family 39 protein [Nocardia sp.]|uniref:ArnT family glycosyltransferase n=1 Tax=Nocardia TaxID=1817 RepID=UPI002453943B|nr:MULTISPECIES: glycosyltransferase family 39 protein [Nocardia]HLS77431.1 glycosyltransferase family 39 protein [Nocardia sp.]